MHGFMRRFGQRFRYGFRHRLWPEGELVSLAQMQNGQSGVVLRILGRHGMVNRLSALGIRPDKRIAKISSMFMRGPVTIQVDRTQVAIGFGMAKRVIVRLD